MIPTLLAAGARVLRRTALPLAAYYGVTLALPVANGAARSDAFVEHAVTVLVVPPIVILFVYGAHTTARALRRGWRLHPESRRRNSPALRAGRDGGLSGVAPGSPVSDGIR